MGMIALFVLSSVLLFSFVICTALLYSKPSEGRGGGFGEYSFANSLTPSVSAETVGRPLNLGEFSVVSDFSVAPSVSASASFGDDDD